MNLREELARAICDDKGIKPDHIYATDRGIMLGWESVLAEMDRALELLEGPLSRVHDSDWYLENTMRKARTGEVW